MLLNILYLFTSLLGLIVVLITLLYRKNVYVNSYLILYFFLGSFRYLCYAITNIENLEKSNIADYAFTTLAWPLLFLYFKNLSSNKLIQNKKSDIKHLVIPFFLFILICFRSCIKDEISFILNKVGVSIVLIYTLGYYFWSLKILMGGLWKKRKSFKPSDKEQIAVRKWTKFLFIILTLMLFRFLANPIINQKFIFLNTNNDFLIVGAVVWIVMYVKLLTSPEVLFGYKVFQDKLNKHKIDFFVFENQWNKSILTEITNKKDLVLNKKINVRYIDYIESIEHISTHNKLFFKQGVNVEDLANKLKIPKSHVVFLFKYYSKISFNEYKSNIRIKKAFQLIQDGYLVSNTMESLAVEVGFSTYSAFFKNFKTTSGISPLEYYQKIISELT